MSAAPGETRDAFLGGRLDLLQPARGYRAGIEPVLLAAAVPARAGDRVLELGCGSGVASLCLAARVGGLALAGVERQAAYAALARRNAAGAGVALEVATADLAALPEAVRGRVFDHVMANPPFHRGASGPAAADPGRAAGRAGETPLATWLEVAVRRLAPGGVLSLVQAADRLPDLLAGLDGRVGGVEVLPLAPREGRAAKLVLLRAIKGRRTPFRLHAPLVLHAGARHGGDGEDYRAEISAVLREGAPLPWPSA